jgi:erythromycin esterase
LVPTRLPLIIGLALLVLPSRPIRAADSDERVAWLKAHAIPLATIDPASTDLADLEPLRGILSGVRIVMLGEATRGDGSAFLAKTRLIRFLYEKLGFDVLVFDDGFYDCARVWDEISGGADTRQALSHTLTPAYPAAAQFQPLIDLIATKAASGRPLAVAGLDDQIGGGTDAKSFAADLRASLVRFGVEPERVSGFAEFETTFGDVLLERYVTGQAAVPSREQQLRVLAALDELRRRLTAWRDPQPSASSPDSAFWLQVLDNVECYAKSSWRLGKYVRGAPFPPELSNIRDRQMAANLVWLERHRFRGRKLIVWSINVQLARDLKGLSNNEAATRARFDVSTLGDEVAKTALGKEVYTIALTAFNGSMRTSSRQPVPLLVPTDGSFEDLMARTGLEAAFLDLRHLPAGSWLQRDLIARPITYKEVMGVWPRHLDALLFLRTLEPSKAR